MMKYVDPMLVVGFVVWFLFLVGECDNPERVHSLRGRLLLVLSLPLLIMFTKVLIDAVTVKRVSIADGGLLVTGVFRSELIPINAVLCASQRRWPKDRRVKLTLKSPYLGKTEIYFMPSTLAQIEAERRLSFWRRFKWHPHPIVDELNQLVKEVGETNG